MQIDVVVLTKNSEKTLERCLDSILGNVPLNRLIAIDGGSSDKTVKILEKFNAEIHMDQGNRATARQKGIGLVETEWFAFVDSDVILCENWYNKVSKFIGLEVGAISGIEHLPFVKSWHRLYNNASFLLTFKRGVALTQNGLIRLKAVKNIEIPKDLHWFEDDYILKHIRRMGWKYIVTPQAYGIHLRSEKHWSISEILKDCKNSRFWLHTDVWLAELFHGIICIRNLGGNILWLK